MKIPHHRQRHEQDYKVCDNPWNWWQDGEKLLVAAVAWYLWIESVIDGQTDQSVCENCPNPPQHYYHANDLGGYSKCRRDKDAVEEHQ